MFFQLIPVNGALWVKGASHAPAVGSFAGHVIAVGLQEYDPVASPAGERTPGERDAEGLLGWGTTHFLVADADKPAPVWVAKVDVDEHRFTPPAPSAALGSGSSNGERASDAHAQAGG